MKRFVGFAVAASAFLATSALAQDKKTERVFKSKCASCHGMDGKAQTEKGKQMKIADMTSADFKARKDEDLKKAILEGVKKEADGVKKEMDPFKDELKPEQVDGLVQFVKGLK